jgi:GMP synthase (glutamine-hydrolysing)
VFILAVMPSGPVMLLQLGEAMDPVREVHGGYQTWFEQAWGGAFHVVDGRPGGPLPDPRGFAAVVVTGSPASLAEPEPWMDDACELVVRARDAGTPLLGVCFGHQLIGRAAGGRVVVNPAGWEIGTCRVEIGDHGRRDWLFDGLPDALDVNLTHRDAIDPHTLPAEVRVLAGNDKTPIQAVAWGEHVRGVQFHPEITGAVARKYVAYRRHLLHGQDPEALIARTVDSPHGVKVLRNFRAMCSRSAA